MRSDFPGPRPERRERSPQAMVSTYAKQSYGCFAVHRVFDLVSLADSSASPGLMKKRKVEFSSHTGNLALMRKFVRSFLEPFPLSEKERMLMVLGVDEACTNIIRHAYHLREDQLITLSLEPLHHCIRLRLRDYGRHTKTGMPIARKHDLI